MKQPPITSGDLADPRTSMGTRNALFVSDIYLQGIYSNFTLGARSSEFGVTIVNARQPSGYYPHPETPELWIGVQTLGSGRAQLDLGAGKFTTSLEPGDALVRPPNSPSQYYLEHEHSFSLVSLNPFGPYLKAAAEMGFVDFKFEFAMTSAIRSPLLPMVVDHLWGSMDPYNPAEQVRVEASTIFLLSLIASACDLPLPKKHYKGGLTPFQVTKIKAYLRDHYRNDISISDMATLVGLSSFHFIRAFQKSFGSTPHQFLTVVRLDKAIELLRASSKSIEEVAYDVGFLNRQNLLRAFKKVHGISPSEFKRL